MRCRGKGGGAAPEGCESRGVAPGIACVPPKRGEQGELCGGCFGSPRTGECRCRLRAEREKYPAGTPRGEALVCLAAAGGVRGRHSGASPALGNMTPRLSFSPGGGLCGRTSASARGGRRVRSVWKERKLGAPEAPRFGRRGCGAGPGRSAGRSRRSMRAGGKEAEPCGRALQRGAGGLPDAFRRRAGVRQKASRFPRRTSCRRAFP